MKTQEEKDGLLALLKRHQDADDFIRGTWLRDEENELGEKRGCFYGCTMQTDNGAREAFSEKYGIDLWYCYLTEKIFEGLPKGEFEAFPFNSIGVVPLDFDFNKIKSPFNKALLLKQLDWITYETVRAVLINTAKLFDTPFNEIDKGAARSAESAARSAARSAESAAWSAAWSAESAARSAARENFYVWMRDTLFALIKENA